jgi:glycosyltransferase involved in cell wall biosynthesis
VLIKELLKRKRFDYELFFFDKNKELGNKQYVDEMLNGFDVAIHECNTVSYKELMTASAGGIKKLKDVFDVDCDIVFFQRPAMLSVPESVSRVNVFHDPWFLTYSNLVDITDVEKTRYSNAKSIFETIIKDNSFVFTLSGFSEKQLLKFSAIKKENLFGMPGIYDSEVCFKELNTEYINKYTGGSPYLLFIGKLDTKKNLERIIKAFEIINARRQQLKLVLIGNYGKLNDESKYYSNMIASSSACDNIIVLHNINDTEKRWFYSNAELLFFPSLIEGFGIPIVEAQACGCPVVTSNTTACPFTAGKGGAVMVSPFILDDIVSGVERILTDSELRERLISKGYTNAELYTPEKCAVQVENAFETIFNRKR